MMLGCAVGQGWYFGKPMPGEEAGELLALRNHESDRPPLSAAG
jgi:EAL domain-containing protein (putative c-di-GMP-specific phosphodiesterase class I)